MTDGRSTYDEDRLPWLEAVDDEDGPWRPGTVDRVHDDQRVPPLLKFLDERWITSVWLTRKYRACNDAYLCGLLPGLQPCQSATRQSCKPGQRASTL